MSSVPIVVFRGRAGASKAPSAPPRRRAVPRPVRGRSARRPRSLRWRTRARARRPPWWPPHAATAVRRHGRRRRGPRRSRRAPRSGRCRANPSPLSTARSAATAGATPSSCRVVRSRCSSAASSDAALAGQRALGGRGQHLQRVEHLGDLAEAAQPGESGAGEHDGVELAAGHLARSGCRRCPGSARARGRARARELGDPPRRAGADHRAGGQFAEHHPVAGDERVARVLARRHGGQRHPRHRGGREVLVGVHGDVDLVGEQRVAQRGDEDADAGLRDRCARRLAAVAVGGDRDDLDLAPAAAAPRRRCRSGCARAGSPACRSGSCGRRCPSPAARPWRRRSSRPPGTAGVDGQRLVDLVAGLDGLAVRGVRLGGGQHRGRLRVELEQLAQRLGVGVAARATAPGA